MPRDIETIKTVATLEHSCLWCEQMIGRMIYCRCHGKPGHLVICAPCAKELAELLGFKVVFDDGEGTYEEAT